MTRAVKRLVRAEKLISELLRAWDNSEMSNVTAALDAMRAFLWEI